MARRSDARRPAFERPGAVQNVAEQAHFLFGSDGSAAGGKDSIELKDLARRRQLTNRRGGL